MHAFIHDSKHGISAISNHSILLLSMKELISRPQSQKERWAVRRAHDWYVHISPQTRGRWILSCRNGQRPEDYSSPFGRWLGSLEEAKNKALAQIEEGMNDLAEFAYQR
jgi:hypothetical protein